MRKARRPIAHSLACRLASVNPTALHHHVRASQQPLVPSARRPAAPRLRPRPSASRPSARRSTPSLRTSATRQRSLGSPISTRACSTATTQVGPSGRRSIERATTPITRTESTRTRIEAAVLDLIEDQESPVLTRVPGIANPPAARQGPSAKPANSRLLRRKSAERVCAGGDRRGALVVERLDVGEARKVDPAANTVRFQTHD
jgi:hypothetical protein